MPEAKRPAIAGKSVHEIMSRWSAQARLRPNVQAVASNGDTPHEDGLLNRVNRLREEMQERRIAEMALGQTEDELALQKAETESRRAEAETKTLESRSRLEALREQLKGGGSESQSFTLLAVLELLKEAQERAYTKNETTDTDKMYDLMREQLADLRLEIKSRTVEKVEEPLDALTRQMQMLIQVKQVLGELAPAKEERSLSAYQAEHDLNTTIKMHEMELTHQTRKMELEMQQERWRQEIHLKEREIEGEESRSRTLGQALGSLAETLRPIMEDLPGLLRPALQSQSAAAAYATPAVENPSSPTQVATPFSGITDVPITETLRCPNCNEGIIANHSMTRVTCPKCESSFDIDWSN